MEPLKFGGLHDNENCMTNDCPKCVRDIKYELLTPIYIEKMNEEVKWQHWRKIHDRVSPTYTMAPLSELIYELDAQLSALKLNFFTKRA